MSVPTAFLVLVAAASSMLSTGVTQQAADTHTFSRYQIIVDRSPFGPVSAGADIPQPNFAARFSFIGTAKLDENQPLLAIIQDKEANNRTYFKAAGETIGGATVVRIEKSPATKLVLKQGLEVATLTLETKTGVGAAAASAAPAAGQPTSQPPPQPGRAPATGLPAGVRRIPFYRGG